jgi:hypothetical protein
LQHLKMRAVSETLAARSALRSRRDEGAEAGLVDARLGEVTMALPRVPREGYGSRMPVDPPHWPVEFAGPALRCSACGYDLRGLASGGRCPECGKRSASALKSASLQVRKPETPVDAAPGVICVRCGGDLGGNSSHAGCPTCAAPVWLSLDGDWLCVRDPVWLRRVRLGTSLWVWALLIPVALNVIGFATPWFRDAFGGRTYASLEQFYTYRGVVFAIVGLLVRTLEWCAAVFLTAAHLARGGVEPRWVLRRLIRVLVLVDIALEVLAWGTRWLMSEPPSEFDLLLAAARSGVDCALCLGTTVYLRGLCRRLPSVKLVRWLTAILWGFAGFWTLDLLGLGVDAVLGDDLSALGHRGWGWLTLSIAPKLVGFVFFLVFSIWLAVVLARFRRELREIVAPGV